MYVECAERGSSFRAMIVINIELITQISFQLFLLTKVSETLEFYHRRELEIQCFA